MIIPEQETDAHIIRREMTISREDFFRLLPKALVGHVFEISNNAIQVQIGSGTLDILLISEGARKIGALELPVINFTFTFNMVSKATARKFLDKFDLAYQKGGG